MNLLLIDDEPAIRFGIAKYLEGEGFRITEAACLAEARERLVKQGFGAILLDVKLPDGEGIDFLKEIREHDPSVPVVVITGHGTIPMAVEAMRRGADHFLTKPVDLKELEILLNKAMQIGTLRRENRALRERPRMLSPHLGDSPAMQRIEPLLAAACRHRSPLLLRGETGTGKGLMARHVHQNSGERDEPFVELNCAGLKGEFLETELFGHSKGAFTGAVETKEGLLERAHRGTLFLDEIGDMDLTVQAKFLKVLEEKRFRPLGRVEERVSDFRLICATHQDLEKRIESGEFRRDLFYRINTLSIILPPLRERTREMPQLVSHLLRFIVQGRAVPEVGKEVLGLLCSYPWPGNLRELHNVLERAWILSDGKKLRPEHFSSLGPSLPAPAGSDPTNGPSDLDSAEKRHIEQVLREVKGDVNRAAKLLGVSRATLYRKITRHALALDDCR